MTNAAATDPVERLTAVVGQDLAVQMNLLKIRLGQLGLFATMHKLDEATRALGWELAERPEIRR